MTTAAWSSGNANSTDAEFRAWGSEFSSKLLAVGLVKTTDTGQIDWATVLKPTGNSTMAGYEIWRFNDSLQATAPIFLKIQYGTGNSALAPMMRIEFGTASSGAGVLSGTGSGATYSMVWGATGTGSATAVPSYMCHAEGFFGVRWKTGATNGGAANICRTCDANGTPDGKGLVFWSYGTFSGSGTSTSRSVAHVRFESPASVITSSAHGTNEYNLSFVPAYLTASTLPSGDKQAFMFWGGFPDMRPMFGMCAVVASEFPTGSTFSVAMVGSTARTFLSIGGMQYSPVGNAIGSYLFAMLWE